MTKQCRVCNHPKVKDIDREIINGVSIDVIAAEYDVGRLSVHRHRADHLPRTLVKAKEAKEVLRADNLLDQLQQLNNDTMDVIATAKRTRKHDLRLRAIARAEKQLELYARLIGELKDTTHVNVNVLATNDEWIRTRGAILSALEPFPEAKAAVVEALMMERTHALRD